jgi:hypothetical protein
MDTLNHGDSNTVVAILVSVHKHRFHRREAKIAEKFSNENNKTLCVLCVSAVNLFICG